MSNPTSAPQTRIVDALSGQITATPSQFFKALAEADAEIAEVHELRCRVQELEAENVELVERLTSLRAAHEVTLRLLAETRRQLQAVTS